MVYFYGLISFFIALSFASAAYGAAASLHFEGQVSASYVSPDHADTLAAANAAVVLWKNGYPNSGSNNYSVYTVGTCDGTQGTVCSNYQLLKDGAYLRGIVVISSCPTGFTKLIAADGTPSCSGASVCAAPSVFDPVTWACNTPSCPVGPLFGGGPRTVVDTGGANTSCVAGCTVSCTGTCVGATGATGSYTYGTAWTSTGQTCTGSPTTQPTSCPKGQVPGEFNGATICLPSAPPDTAKTDTQKTQTTVNPDGSTTVTTTTATTTCGGDGACSTNTTIVTNNFAPGVNPATGTPASTATKTDQKQEPKTSFCEENPNSFVCKKLESTFGGGCGSFSCDGDAVQCAIAQDQHKRNCQLFDTATPLSDLGNTLTSGTENLTGAVRSSQANRDVINLSGSLNQSKVFAGGCIPDRSYTLWRGTNFTIPFSSLCPYLNFMGAIVLAFAYLSAARIVGVV